MPSRPVWYGCDHLMSKVTKAFKERHGLEDRPQVSTQVRGRAKTVGCFGSLFPKTVCCQVSRANRPCSILCNRFDGFPSKCLGPQQRQAKEIAFCCLLTPLVSTKPFFRCLLTVSLDLKCVRKLIVFKFCTSAVIGFIGSTVTKHLGNYAHSQTNQVFWSSLH